MPHIVAGWHDELPSDIRNGLGIFRHRVFVQRLGWTLPDATKGVTTEWDQFDRKGTIQIVALTPGQSVCGCARLMPTTGPYLLKDVFPELSGPNAPPVSPSVWELSRFAGSGSLDDQSDAAPGMRLFPYALALATSLGAARVIGVVTRSVARLYRQSGLELQSIGLTVGTCRQPFLACAIDLTPAMFERLGCDPADLLGSISWFGPRPSRGIFPDLAPSPDMPTASEPTARSTPSQVLSRSAEPGAQTRRSPAA
jgi:N-acyl-L-homoserine lactone synthetase